MSKAFEIWLAVARTREVVYQHFDDKLGVIDIGDLLIAAYEHGKMDAQGAQGDTTEGGGK